MDKEKFEILLNDKDTPVRSKLIFSLLYTGMNINDVLRLAPKDIPIFKTIYNGEALFQLYISRRGIMDSIIKSNLLFPSTTGKVMKLENLLVSLRTPCRKHGFQLYELGVEGLVKVPNQAKKYSFTIMTLDEMQNYILSKQNTPPSPAPCEREEV